MRYLALIGATVMMTTPVQATTIPDFFSSFWVLGDSLSDNQNTAVMVGTINAQEGNQVTFPPASPLQQPGVASDGFTWAKELNDEFSAAGKANANLSFGSARASENGDGPPDLGAQIAPAQTFTTSFSFNLNPLNPAETTTISGTAPKYGDGQGGLLDRKDQWGANPLVTVFIGGNDFLDAAGAIATGLGTPEDILPTVVANTFASVTSNIATLVDEGVSDFMVMNLPDFSLIPQFNGEGAALGAAVSAAAASYNNLLEQYLNGLRAAGLSISEVDIFAGLSDRENLSNYGITNFDDACVFNVDPASQDCSGYLYFDNIHPTSQGHAAVTDLARAALNETYGLQPIPLPAPALMLITALGGTLLLRRRRVQKT